MLPIDLLPPVEFSGNVIMTLSLLLEDIFPAASLVQAYKIFVPSEEKVYEIGELELHP